jgi:hypothetical protein
MTKHDTYKQPRTERKETSTKLQVSLNKTFPVKSGYIAESPSVISVDWNRTFPFQPLRKTERTKEQTHNSSRDMDFLHLFDDDQRKVVPLSPKVVKRLNMRTPPGSPNRLKIPDLMDSDRSDSSSNEGSNSETVSGTFCGVNEKES